MTPVETVSRWAEGARKALEDYHRALSDGLGGALAASKLAIGLEETFAAELTGPHVTDARLVEVQDAIAALVKAERERATAAPVRAEGEATHRHKKRGTDYVLIGFGTYVCFDHSVDYDDVYVREVAPGVWHVEIGRAHV